MSRILVIAVLSLVCISSLVECYSSSRPAYTSDPSIAGSSILSKHSFSGPYNTRFIPYWNYGAGASVNNTYVRLTPQRQSRTGFIWNSIHSELAAWEVEFEFQVIGLKNYGGDGFAFWYTEKPELIGPVYGSADYWTGLGIMFDTFNNDNQGSSPLISAIFNDGTQKYDASSDGATQAAASCTIDFRNQAEPTIAKIRYEKEQLSLDIALNSNAQGAPNWIHCFTIEKVYLGVDKYFGITAHTGDVADSHDIYSFHTINLSPASVDLTAVREDYQHKLDEQHQLPEHQELTPQQFQHSVLTSLNQIQQELNLIEMNQLDTSELLNQNFAFIHDTLVGYNANNYDPNSNNNNNNNNNFNNNNQQQVPPPQQQQQQLQQPVINPELLTNMGSKLDSLQDQQSTILSTLRGVHAQISNPRNSNNNNPSSAIDSTTQRNINELKESVSLLNNKLERILDIVSKIESRSNSLLNNNDNNSNNNNNQPVRLGWFTYSQIFFSFTMLIILTAYTFIQHNKRDRYKMI